jgi:transcription antitermination factor NusG
MPAKCQEERMEIVNTEEKHPWYAVHVRVRYEKNVERNLSGKGYTCFVPVYECARRWGNRDRTVALPLFASYVFCRFNAQDRLPILVTPGVISIVGFSDGPVAVDENEMNNLIAAVNARAGCTPHPFLKIGERARIVAGPLTGVEGVLIRNKHRSRLVLSVELLHRSVAVEVDETWIEQPPLSAAAHAVSNGEGWTGNRQALRPCG